MTLQIHDIGGNCPVQSTGIYLGRRFHVRAMYKHVEVTIAHDLTVLNALHDDTAWHWEEAVPDAYQYGAGWLNEHEVLAFMARAFAAFDAHLMGLAKSDTAR